MGKNTTNYFDTFISVAPDSEAAQGTVPPARKTPSVAALTYDKVMKSPYKYSSDDVLFGVFADRKELKGAERKAARTAYFSKGQPCFRASPLPKQYGWGVHSDAEGKVALYGVESAEYKRLASGDGVEVVKPAMRSRRK